MDIGSLGETVFVVTLEAGSMQFHVGGLLILAVAAIATAVGCTSGNVVLTPAGPGKGGGASTSSAPTASPAPTATTVRTSAAPSTPTAAPTPVPSVTASTIGSTACTAPVLTDGTYTSIYTSGVVTGNTYTEESGDFETDLYTPATPTPVPTVTSTPGPTAAPTTTPVPSPTPTPVMVTLYYGEYTAPSYSGNALTGGSYTAAAMTGCFYLVLEQPVGGSAGQSRMRRVTDTATPAPNADGFGSPNEPGTEAETIVDSGMLSSLSISNLTPSSGSGSFSFTNSAANTATGTITITGSETIVSSPDLRRRMHAGPTYR
jgi:hypothetical protein